MNAHESIDQKTAPPAAGAPLKVFFAAVPRGNDIKNFPKIRPAAAESNTSQPAPATAADPWPGFGDTKTERNELYTVQPVAKILIPEAPVQHAPPTIVQPGDYHPGYCEQMLSYFDRPKMREIIDTYSWKSGAVTEKIRHVPNTPPHFSEFARTIGVTTRKLKMWYRAHPEFAEAYDTCNEILEEFLIDNGLIGGYGPVAMKFVAVNKTKMKDKVVNENRTVDMNKVLDMIARGEIRPGGTLENIGDDAE